MKDKVCDKGSKIAFAAENIFFTQPEGYSEKWNAPLAKYIVN